MFRGLAYVLITIVYIFFSFAMVVLKIVQGNFYFIKKAQIEMGKNTFLFAQNADIVYPNLSESMEHNT